MADERGIFQAFLKRWGKLGKWENICLGSRWEWANIWNRKIKHTTDSLFEEIEIKLMYEYLDSQLTQTLFNTVKHQQAIKSKVINAQLSPPPPPPPPTLHKTFIWQLWPLSYDDFVWRKAVYLISNVVNDVFTTEMGAEILINTLIGI